MKGFFTCGLLLFIAAPAIAQEIETPNNKAADSLFVAQHEAYAKHSFETARELLKTALLNKRMSRSYEPHFELGEAEFALENFEAAAKSYAQALQLAQNQGSIVVYQKRSGTQPCTHRIHQRGKGTRVTTRYCTTQRIKERCFLFE